MSSTLKAPLREVLSGTNSIQGTRRYLRRFPAASYPKQILDHLKLDPKDRDQSTPHCISYRIPKDLTTCSRKLIRKMKTLNDDRLWNKTKMNRDDQAFFNELISCEKEALQLAAKTEAFWDKAIQDGVVAEDYMVKYQFKQFKKVPPFETHPRTILRDLKVLKQAFQQRLRMVNSPEIKCRGHNAALVLVTPGLADLVGQKFFEEQILKIWPFHSRDRYPYHIVTAVVDGTHLPDEDSTSTSEGISIIRGSQSIMFPDLWEEREPRETEIKDDVGALSFDMGGVATVTVPLANTLFQNGKMSTLRATKVVSGEARESKDLFDQHIRLPSMIEKMTAVNRSVTSLRLPIAPITDIRVVRHAFGNILKHITIKDGLKPASIELEAAITQMQDRIAERSQELGIEFPGVWAVVFPHEKGHIPKWHVDTRSPHDDRPGVTLSPFPNPLQLDKPGFAPNPLLGRPFKILSGGGGWGDKAGLLALDPQLSHFAKSEEEASRSLFGGGKVDFTYIPSGSAVQFYISDERNPMELGERRDFIRRGSSRLNDFPMDNAGVYLDTGDAWYEKNKDNAEVWEPPEKKPYFGTDGVPRIMFGVGSRLPPPKGHDSEMSLHVGEFGAISNKAIYVAESKMKTVVRHAALDVVPEMRPMKLDMPGAQLQLANW